MKIKTLHFLTLATTLATSLMGVGQAQTTATTTPVGYITVTIPGATPPVIPEVNVAFAVQVYNLSDFQGAVATVTAPNQFTLTGASFTAGAFATASAPRGVRIMTGAQQGLLLLVTANTTNQLTVALPSGVTDINQDNLIDINDILAVGNTVQVLPINTFGSLFGTTTPLLMPGETTDDGDVVFLLSKDVSGNDKWLTFWHNGTNWRRLGTGANQNNTILYPDEGVFIVHRGTSPVTLTMMGTVPSTNEQTDLFGNGSTFLANRFPVDIQFVNSGIDTTANWVKNEDVNLADKVYLWNTTTRIWQTYWHNGTNWRRTGSGANKNTDLIKAGSAVVISRQSPTGAVLTQTLPYTP